MVVFQSDKPLGILFVLLHDACVVIMMMAHTFELWHVFTCKLTKYMILFFFNLTSQSQAKSFCWKLMKNGCLNHSVHFSYSCMILAHYYWIMAWVLLWINRTHDLVCLITMINQFKYKNLWCSCTRLSRHSKKLWLIHIPKVFLGTIGFIIDGKMGCHCLEFKKLELFVHVYRPYITQIDSVNTMQLIYDHHGKSLDMNYDYLIYTIIWYEKQFVTILIYGKPLHVKNIQHMWEHTMVVDKIGFHMMNENGGFPCDGWEYYHFCMRSDENVDFDRTSGFPCN